MTTYSAVVTTGIYCRPGCSAKPLAENVQTFTSAAAAEAAGFRACLRCRPYRTSASIPVDPTEFVCRAIQLIIEGVLDDGNETELASRLSVSPRHVRRVFNEQLGLTPDQLARSRRAHFARRLLDDSDLSIIDVAFASGFGSLRQFNRAMREIFREPPLQLRRRRRIADRLAIDGGLSLRMPFEPPLDWDVLVQFLSDRAVPGVESVDRNTYRRTISVDSGPGVVEVWLGGDDHLMLRAHLPYWEGLIHVVERVARLFGANRDVSLGATHLARDPVLGPLVAAYPGVRIPGAWGPFEVGVHAVLADQSGLEGARAGMSWLVQHFGLRVPGLTHGLTHLFPSAEALAHSATASRTNSPVALERVWAFSKAVVEGRVRLDGAVPLDELVESMTAVPGIGLAAAHQLAMRLGERDAYPASDPDVRAALSRLGVVNLHESARGWRPWRALAAMYLLSSSVLVARARKRSA